MSPFNKFVLIFLFISIPVYFVFGMLPVIDLGKNHRWRNPIPVFYEEGVVGDPVYLPCDISIAEGPKESEDAVVLVLWYREDLGTPIYSVDTREKDIQHAERWSDERVFGPRAYFLPEKQPAQLAVDNVRETDQGIYRCRVDFKFAQTRNSKVHLNVTVPPQKILITDENGATRTSVVGPYLINSTLILRCNVFGGKPAPSIIWFKNDLMIANKTFTKMDNPVELNVIIRELQRSDLHSELMCRTFNNNRTQPIEAVVQIDMNFGPLDVQILNSNNPLTAGRKYDLLCQSSGSRPPAKLTWWKDGRRLDRTKDTTSSDGNTTTSTLTFVPKKEDTGKHLSCRAENPEINQEYLDTGWNLDIYYAPEVKLQLGTSLQPDTIREGVDVYFDCIVNSLPSAYKVEWKHNGQLLQHNVGHGIIISNQSLVLQRVSKLSAGRYTCVAYNTEGETESNVFNLNVMFSPICKRNQTRVYGISKLERSNITCEVEANPNDVQFSWAFNNSIERVSSANNNYNKSKLPGDIFQSSTTSVMTYTPTADVEYGTLFCWATNKVGSNQISPCVFHIIAAGKPDRVFNCSTWNITTISFSLTCTEGYNGGMPQTFALEVRDTELDEMKANISNLMPQFAVDDLHPGVQYTAIVTAVNVKGRSEATILEITTLGKREIVQNLKEEMHHEETFHLTPTMSIVIGVVLSLIIAACIIATILQIHCSRIENQNNSNKNKNRNLRNNNDVVYSSNDSVSSSEKTISRENGGTSCGIVEKVFSRQTSPNVNNTSCDPEERDPDLIPQPITADVDEHRDFLNRMQRVSTIDSNIAQIPLLFQDGSNIGIVPNTRQHPHQHYPAYCTLRNGTLPLQDLSHLSTNQVLLNMEQPSDNMYYSSYGSCTLPRRNWAPCLGADLGASAAATEHHHYNTMHHHRPVRGPIKCSIPEEEISPSSTPLISPKQESAV